MAQQDPQPDAQQNQPDPQQNEMPKPPSFAERQEIRRRQGIPQEGEQEGSARGYPAEMLGKEENAGDRPGEAATTAETINQGGSPTEAMQQRPGQPGGPTIDQGQAQAQDQTQQDQQQDQQQTSVDRTCPNCHQRGPHQVLGESAHGGGMVQLRCENCGHQRDGRLKEDEGSEDQ